MRNFSSIPSSKTYYRDYRCSTDGDDIFVSQCSRFPPAVWRFQFRGVSKCVGFTAWVRLTEVYHCSNAYVDVEYQNVKGERVEKRMTELEARVFQHEYDHLNGVCFDKKVSKLKLDMAKKRAEKLKRKIEKLDV